MLNYDFLKHLLLFKNITDAEMPILLDALQAKHHYFAKGSIICPAGKPITQMGVVLSGSVYIENNDIWGYKSILDHLTAGQVFAETYACVPDEPLMVSVIANEACEVLFINTSFLYKDTTEASAVNNKLIKNLLLLSAQKNLSLSRRIFHTSAKSIRMRILYYLSFQAKRQGNLCFKVPFNRQQLAEYLNVDRSALSHELSKLQKEGVISVNKNTFCLNQSFLIKEE